MKNMKKVIAMLLCVLLLVGLLPAMAFAEEVGFAESISTENEAAFAAAKGVLTQSEAVERLYTDLTSRTGTDSFSVYLTSGQESNPVNAFSDLVNRAIAHAGTEDPAAGDYLAYQSSYELIDHTLVKGNVSYYLEVELSFSYTMPAAEEDDAAFWSVYNTLNLSTISDTQEKVAAIYKYLNENVTYSPMTDIGTEYVKVTAYGALSDNHEADTLGFALAFYRIALTAGIDARVVYGYDPEDNEVYWNLVQIGENWYLLNAASCYSDYLRGLNDYAGYYWSDEELKTEYNISANRYGYADVNGDSVVNLQDLLTLRRYLAGVDGITIVERGADMNEDTYVNLQDLLMLKQVLANA